jgi:hypothetical protein
MKLEALPESAQQPRAPVLVKQSVFALAQPASVKMQASVECSWLNHCNWSTLPEKQKLLRKEETVG